MVLGEDGKPVGSYLVGDVAVRGDPVGADDHEVDRAFGHEARRHVVADDGGGHAGMGELPARETGPLPQRPRLVGEDALDFSLLGGGVDAPERRAVEHRREASGVAVGEHARALGEKPGAGGADGAVRRLVLLLDPQHLVEERVGRSVHARVLGDLALGDPPHALDRPGEVHRRGARLGDLVGDGAEFLQEAAPGLGASAGCRLGGADVHRPERHGGGTGGADCGRTADREGLHRAHHLMPVARFLEARFTREQAFVEVGERGRSVVRARKGDAARQVVEAEVAVHCLPFVSVGAPRTRRSRRCAGAG